MTGRDGRYLLDVELPTDTDATQWTGTCDTTLTKPEKFCSFKYQYKYVTRNVDKIYFIYVAYILCQISTSGYNSFVLQNKK